MGRHRGDKLKGRSGRLLFIILLSLTCLLSDDQRLFQSRSLVH